MPTLKPRKRKQRGEVMPLLSVSDKIDSLLKEMLTTFPAKREVTVEEIEHWHKDLQPFPIQAIEWAFDCHRRNARFFPVPGEILDLCIEFSPITGTSDCDAECKRRHGKGYGENRSKGFYDITRLNELVRRKIQAEKRTLAQPLTDTEINGLLDELDKMRGYKPQWRESA